MTHLIRKSIKLVTLCLVSILSYEKNASFFSFSGKMGKVKIFPHLAGNTLGSHEKFLRKLKKKGAEVVKNCEKIDAIVVFCPIVSRFDTDVKSALTSLAGKHAGNILCNVLTLSCKS